MTTKLAIYNEKYEKLKVYRKENKEIFRRQLASRIKTLSLDLDIDDIKECLEIFRLEIIQESYFFIDFLNNILLNLLKFKFRDFHLFKQEVFFISKIGDVKTLEILTSFSKEKKSNKEISDWLKLITSPLKDKIDKIEKKIEDIKLYEMEEIFNQWLD